MLIRFLLKLFIFAFLLLPFILLAFSVNDTPLVNTQESPSHYDIARIKNILKQHDPRKLKQGETGYLKLSEQDINTLLLASLTLLNSPLKETRAKTHLHNDIMKVNLSFKLPQNQFGQYANMALSLKESALHRLTIEQISFGTLNIPGWLAQPVWNFFNQFFDQYEEYKRLHHAVQMIQITEKQLQLTYTTDWEVVRQLQQRGQALLLSDSDQKRIRVYQNHLVKMSKKYNNNHAYKPAISLTVILKPLFQLALTRSSKQQQSTSIEENKALLFVLAMHASGKNIDALPGSDATGKTESTTARMKVSLHNRVDLMKHFTISAFLASATTNALANATGLYKEISDSKGGSGFSFADFAADRAGVEFGTMAVASEASAHLLQLHMAKISNEKDYMPAISNLPEGLGEVKFKRQYGTTEDIRYIKMQQELDKRIRSCRLYSKGS